MPDFTSHINLMPEDKITPAINDLTNTLMRVEMVKRAEDERKMARLVDLTTVALGDMSAGDYADLQKQKEDFFNYTTSKYQESDKNGQRGNLPFSVQAELNAKKQTILRYAAKAEQDKKDIHDVMKLAATNKDVDQEETAANLRAYLKTPIAQRGDAWDIVSLNFDTGEYIKKNLVRIPKETTEITGKFGAGTYNKTVFEANDALSQQLGWYKTRPDFKKGIDKEMSRAGIDSSSPDNVRNYLYNTYALPQAEDNFKFQQHNRTNIYNISGTEDTPTGIAPTNSVIIKSNRTATGDIIAGTTADGKPVVEYKGPSGSKVYKTSDGKVVDVKDVNMDNTYVDQTLETGDIATVKNVNVSFMASPDNVNVSAHGPELNTTSSSNLEIKVNGIQPRRSYYSERTGRWFPATKEWIAAHPKEKTEMKRYIVGAKDVYDPEAKKTYEGDAYAIPATKANVDQLRKQLGPKSPISPDLEDDFGKPKKTTSSSGQGKTASYEVQGKVWTYQQLIDAGNTPADIDAYLKSGKIKKK